MKEFLKNKLILSEKLWDIVRILVNSIPILLMIWLIPYIENDYFLTLFYILIILGALSIKCTKIDVVIFFCGLGLMTVFEYIFISTGVEIFVRNSLFGVMPLWLPFLWGYGFIAIARSVKILEKIF